MTDAFFGPRIVSDVEFLGRTFLEPPEIVGGGVLGDKALTLLTGQEGIGKSLLVMQLAIHLSRGESWLGHNIHSPHTVLLVQKELPDAALQARLRTQLTGRTPTGRLHLVETAGGVRFAGPGLYPEGMERWIYETRPHVIIIDPLVEFHEANENKADEMAQAVLRPVGHWKGLGCSVILVHHHGKPSEEAPRMGTNRIRGSSVLAGSCDTNLQLIEVNRDKGWYQLDFAKLRRTAPQRSLAMLRDPNTLLYQERGAHVSLLAYLEGVGGELPLRDLVVWASHHLDIAEVTVYKAVDRLEADGRVVKLAVLGRGGGTIIRLVRV